jgi:isoquinoline 1-oxidoreductase subunit beta
MGIKRRIFLIGSASLIGGGLFALHWLDRAANQRAAKLVENKGEKLFSTWVKIADDDTITIYSPHIDFGQGTHTALAQMLVDELDGDWAKVLVEQAPADAAFASSGLVSATLQGMIPVPKVFAHMLGDVASLVARQMNLQITGGSTAIRMTGQYGMRVAGAAVRAVLIDEAAARLGVKAAELSTKNSVIMHAGSGKSLRYGELANKAAERSLSRAPALKALAAYQLMGKPIARLDIPDKATGKAQYGIDFSLPDMRVATIQAAPIRGGELISVDAAPAMAVAGVEKVIQLKNAVAVVAKGYWQALQGLRALTPKFSDGGNGGISSASIFAAHDALDTKLPRELEVKVSKIEAHYRVPFLHQAMMEPFALVAHFKDGKLDVWGGLQDPVSTRDIAAKAAGLEIEKVIFHPMMMGGGFGRRFPNYCQIIGQVCELAKQLPYPIKLIYSREEEITQGAYRPQVSAWLQASLGADGKISRWHKHYVQQNDAGEEAAIPYQVPDSKTEHSEYTHNQVMGFWRSVDASQHGFFNECFIDELAQVAKADPIEFRLRHLPADSRLTKVLQTLRERSQWQSEAPANTARGVAIVESFGSVIAQVAEVTQTEDGKPKVLKVFAVVDCGLVVNPINAEAQVQGSIIMGLSAALAEKITLEKGAVVQSNFYDYPVLQMKDTPVIDVHFLASDAPIGGLGEPGLPPIAPALANAWFALTGKRVRELPLLDA